MGLRLRVPRTIQPAPCSPTTPLGLLAADYGLAARSASGIRGEDVDDWPCTKDPSGDLLRSHLTRLLQQPSLDPTAIDLISASRSTADPPTYCYQPVAPSLR